VSGVPHCDHEPRSERFVAKPIGSFSIAGAQPKVVAVKIEVCDDCWKTISEHPDPWGKETDGAPG